MMDPGLRRAGMTALLLVSIPAYSLDLPPKSAIPLPSVTFNFDKDTPGTIPSHFIAAVTGDGPSVHWEVRRDYHPISRPNILVQSGRTEPGANAALLILQPGPFDHGEISVRFKILSGGEDQAAGILWNYRDPQTYSVVRASAQEDNCAVYVIKRGKRKVIDQKAAVVTPYTWHELRLVFTRDRYTAFVDGELAMGGINFKSLAPGQVGLWTSSDSNVAFDDLQVAPLTFPTKP
jgi:hypothetical protein